MLSRREVLAALAATAWAAPSWAASGRLWPPSFKAAPGRLRPPHALDPLGIQLYTLRSLMRQQGVERTLALVSEIGYREVEFAGYFDHGAAEIRDMLERTGLSAPAAHVGFPELGDAWSRTLDVAAEIGHRYVVTPWIPPEWRTAAGYARVAERFNRAGEAALARGLRFAYHNQDFEFAMVGAQRGFDVLLEQTDTSLVLVELDVFWAARGGADPSHYFARYPGRFPMVHLKDMAPGGAMVDVGRGSIDFRAIVRQAPSAGIRHYFVEHDQPADPERSARNSFTYLRALTP